MLRFANNIQHCYDYHYMLQNLSTTGGLSILIQGAISLTDVMCLL